MTDATPTPKRPQGFAALSPERRQQVARLGGTAVNPANRSFSKSRDLAIEAGRKGGSVKRVKAEG